MGSQRAGHDWETFTFMCYNNIFSLDKTINSIGLLPEISLSIIWWSHTKQFIKSNKSHKSTKWHDSDNYVLLLYLESRYYTWAMKFQMFKLDLEKAEEPEIKLPIFVGSLRKQESSRKTSTSALLIMPKPLTMWITTNCGKFFKRWEYQITWPASWETYMQVRKQQLELEMEQQTGSK